MIKGALLGAGFAFAMAWMIHTGTVTAQQPAAQQPAPRRIGTGFREPDPIAFDDATGFVSIFDGATLKDWDGDPSIWRVENGAIVGESTREKPSGNSYISYHGFEAKDLDLKFEIKVENGGGSGIQYRSKTGLPWRPDSGRPQPPHLEWMMTGPQADFWFPVSPRSFVYNGQIYNENTPLGIIAWRGQVVNMTPGKAPRLVGNIGDRSALGGYIKINDWNQYMVIARGGTFIHIINGQLMAVLVDDDPQSANQWTGMIGIEIEGAPCKVSVRNIRVKKFS